MQSLQTIIPNPQPSLSDNDNIAILQPYDTSDIPNSYIVGRISTPAKGISTINSITKIMHTYDSIAQKNGANIIRFLNVNYGRTSKEPDRATAVLYRVPDIRKYEKRIVWTSKRKLTWEDFKGKIPDTLLRNYNYSSYASIGIQHRSNAAFLVGSGNFFVLSTFDCSRSWYRPYAYFQTNFLEFQQGLFDLTELYARKMRQELASKNVKDKNTFTQNVDKTLSKQYKEAQTQFVQATKGGSDAEALKEWHEKIWAELAKM
ncbi:MAG: hypothetical protein DI598_13495 [Pseudopedobacter saltans]|uniref:Uncharacterized protein n=1 Tax=Pseudopedobacter saltans TaxID=151895 RepID=A0A2W5GTM3_9SPHI|nr:MAG: hypothetical protein DI598_13495 [Pseudopedobacter saltans]